MFLPHFQTNKKRGHTFFKEKVAGGVIAIFAAHSLEVSANPCATPVQIASAAAWDAIGAIDPVGVTDVIDAYTGLDGGRGGLGGIVDAFSPF